MLLTVFLGGFLPVFCLIWTPCLVSLTVMLKNMKNVFWSSDQGFLHKGLLCTICHLDNGNLNIITDSALLSPLSVIERINSRNTLIPLRLGLKKPSSAPQPFYALLKQHRYCNIQSWLLGLQYHLHAYFTSLSLFLIHPPPHRTWSTMRLPCKESC